MWRCYLGPVHLGHCGRLKKLHSSRGLKYSVNELFRLTLALKSHLVFLQQVSSGASDGKIICSVGRWEIIGWFTCRRFAGTRVHASNDAMRGVQAIISEIVDWFHVKKHESSGKGCKVRKATAVSGFRALVSRAGHSSILGLSQSISNQTKRPPVGAVGADYNQYLGTWASLHHGYKQPATANSGRNDRKLLLLYQKRCCNSRQHLSSRSPSLQTRIWAWSDHRVWAIYCSCKLLYYLLYFLVLRALLNRRRRLRQRCLAVKGSGPFAGAHMLL